MRWRFLCGFLLVAVLGLQGQTNPSHPHTNVLPTRALFITARYGASDFVIFFTDEGAKSVASAGLGKDLRLVETAKENAAWSRAWPADAGAAPQLLDKYLINLGGSNCVPVELHKFAVLIDNRKIWMAGLASVQSVGLNSSSRFTTGQYFLAHRSDAQSCSVLAQGAETPLLGAVQSSGAPDFLLNTAQQATLERVLNRRLSLDYQSFITEQQQLYMSGTHSIELARVTPDELVLRGEIKPVYTIQKVMVAGQTERYRVRAQWNDLGHGSVYTLSAWFTPELELESVDDHEFSGSTTLADNGSLVNGFVPFPPDKNADPNDVAPQQNLFIVTQHGKDALRYVLMRWTTSGLLPMGVYFGR